MSAPTEPQGASALLVILGNLLVVLSFLTDRPVSVVLAAAGLFVLVPEAVRAFRAWRRTRPVAR